MASLTVEPSASRMRELSRRWRTYRKDAPSGSIDSGIGFAASFTVDPVADYVGALLLDAGKSNPNIAIADYNQIVGTCLNPESSFGTNSLEMIVLLFRLEDLAEAAAPDAVRAALELHLSAIARLREGYTGTIVIGLPPRPRPVSDLTSFARPTALEGLWFEALAEISGLTRNLPNTYSIDLEAAIARLGEATALDYRKEVLYRLPYAESFSLHLAQQVMRVYSARRAASKKCLVLDCDNTLWGGIIGEDGIGGVQLSDDHPGRAFVEFQRQLKALRDSGIFLALCSKNNPDDVAEMFDSHAGMVIRMGDISVSRVNWRPKSENLREIANELNIGADALVFIDDNPFEIDEVRTHLPEVTCIQVPDDIADLPPLVRANSFLFDRLEITDDDRARTDMMRLEMQRRELSQKLTEADFLASLGLEVTLFVPSPADQARVAQLINKTNQFNVTTKRYSSEEVETLVADANVDLFCANVSDRFGNYGLVGVCIVRHAPDEATIDSLLMSCRVLGRGVESAIIGHAVSLAHKRGAANIGASYVPTRKNGMVANVFDLHKFELTEVSSVGDRNYRRSTEVVTLPTYLNVIHRGLAGSPSETEVAGSSR